MYAYHIGSGVAYFLRVCECARGDNQSALIGVNVEVLYVCVCVRARVRVCGACVYAIQQSGSPVRAGSKSLAGGTPACRTRRASSPDS